MESKFSRHRSRRDVVGSAKRGKEIVERDLVGHVNGRQSQAPFVPVLAEQVVVSQAEVEEVAGGNARWVVVVV